MRRATWVLVVAVSVLLAVGCAGNDGGSDLVDVAMVDVPDVRDASTPGLPEERFDVEEVTPPDLSPACPDEPCGAGNVKCQYAGKAQRLCIQDDDGCWSWGNLQMCAEPKECEHNVGCICQYGPCEALGVWNCSGDLQPCQEWTCEDECCSIRDIPVPECCVSEDDCRDCIKPETGQKTTCPYGPEAGWILNLCTQDICLGHQCWNSAVSCDDGNSITIDECNPETGLCEHLPDPLQTWHFCWGLTEEDAHAKCYDDNLCTIDDCTIDGDFVPWVEGEPPIPADCNPNADDWPECIPEGVYLCKNEDKLLLGTCDDYDPCTIDSCDPEVGCVHEVDGAPEGPFCLADFDCAEGDLCTESYCSLPCGMCAYPPVDCDDGDYCTMDFCAPEEGCKHEATDHPCCLDGVPCLTDDPLECDDGNFGTDDYCFWAPGAECGVCHNDLICDDNDLCTVDYGLFDPEDQTLTCMHEELDCEDGDPQTTNACVDGVCVVH